MLQENTIVLCYTTYRRNCQLPGATDCIRHASSNNVSPTPYSWPTAPPPPLPILQIVKFLSRLPLINFLQKTARKGHRSLPFRCSSKIEAKLFQNPVSSTVRMDFTCTLGYLTTPIANIWQSCETEKRLLWLYQTCLELINTLMSILPHIFKAVIFHNASLETL
jgi:hypothetical protein